MLPVLLYSSSIASETEIGYRLYTLQRSQRKLEAPASAATSIRGLPPRTSIGSLPASRRPVGVGTERTALQRLGPHDLACTAVDRKLEQPPARTPRPNR